MSRRAVWLALTILFLLSFMSIWLTRGSVTAESSTANTAIVDSPSPEDQAAIRATMQSFVKSFIAKDAKALAAHWTAAGEYHDDNGKNVRGREALEKGFTGVFANAPEIKVESHNHSLRFLSKDSAIEEGAVTIRRGPLETPSNATYSAMFVRDQGQWRIAQFFRIVRRFRIDFQPGLDHR